MARCAAVSPRRWAQHSSPERYFRVLSGTFLGVTTRRVAPAAGLLLVTSTLVCAYNAAAVADPSMLPLIHLPLLPFELTVPVLGLLLVFRSDK